MSVWIARNSTSADFELATLALEKLDLLDTPLAVDRQGFGAAAGAGRQHLANFAQGEAESLALQDQADTLAIVRAKDPRRAVAMRRQQPFALIEAQCPQGDARFARQIADGNAVRIVIGGHGNRGRPRSSAGRNALVAQMSLVTGQLSASFRTLPRTNELWDTARV